MYTRFKHYAKVLNNQQFGRMKDNTEPTVI